MMCLEIVEKMFPENYELLNCNFTSDLYHFVNGFLQVKAKYHYLFIGMSPFCMSVQFDSFSKLVFHKFIEQNFLIDVKYVQS